MKKKPLPLHLNSFQQKISIDLHRVQQQQKQQHTIYRTSSNTQCIHEAVYDAGDLIEFHLYYTL